MSEDTHEQYDVLGREFIKRYLDMFEPLVEKLCDTVSINESVNHLTEGERIGKESVNWIKSNKAKIKFLNENIRKLMELKALTGEVLGVARDATHERDNLLDHLEALELDKIEKEKKKNDRISNKRNKSNSKRS